jgi:hypothetical protein
MKAHEKRIVNRAIVGQHADADTTEEQGARGSPNAALARRYKTRFCLTLSHSSPLSSGVSWSG